MEAFFESDHFRNSIDPVPNAFETLLRMKEKYSLHVVTARQHLVEDITRAWLDKYYPNIFDEVHFGNHYSKSGKSRSKAEMCKSIGAKVLIDDSMIYATQCALEDISVVLFGNYAWNQYVDRNPHHHFHDLTIVVNAHMKNEVVIQDFREELYDEDRAVEEFSAGPRHVYRVDSWAMVERAVHYMISYRKDVYNMSSAIASTSAGTGDLHVAVLQLCSVADKSHNLSRIEALITKALADDPLVSLVCLPECAMFMGESSTATSLASEDVASGPSVAALCAVAKDKRIWISLGGFPERSSIASEVLGEDNQLLNKFYNSHILINRDGQVVAPIYRKVHLFDCPLVGLQESKLTLPGNEVVVMDIEGWKVGIAVCYDLRFAGLFEAMGVVDAVLVPAAFTVPTGAAHWEVLLRARAIENQCFVVAAAQSGKWLLARKNLH